MDLPRFDGHSEKRESEVAPIMWTHGLGSHWLTTTSLELHWT